MGNSNSKIEKFVIMPENTVPVDSFDSIQRSDKGQLWYEGFRCKCGFYIEAGCLKEGELELSYIKEDRYKNGHLRFVDFQTNLDRCRTVTNGFFTDGWWDQGGCWYEYGLADLEESDQEYFKKLGYVEKGGTTITSGDQTRYWKKLILPKFEKYENTICFFGLQPKCAKTEMIYETKDETSGSFQVGLSADGSSVSAKGSANLNRNYTVRNEKKVSISANEWLIYGMGLLKAKHVLIDDKVETVKEKSYLCNRCFRTEYYEKFEKAYHNLTNWSKITAPERANI